MLRKSASRAIVAVGMLPLGLLSSEAEAAAEEMLICPGKQVTMPLDDTGQFVMPDLGLRLALVNPDYPVAVTVSQSPLAGQVFTGPQVVFVTATGTDSNGKTSQCRFRLDLVDITPPEVTISLAPEAETKIGPSGVTYFVAPVSVVPTITASDACDPQPSVDTLLDGAKYVLGTPITAKGIHLLRVSSADQSGNTGYVSTLFEIRDRVIYGAIAVVQSFQCIPGPNGLAGVSGTILLASNQFDVKDISLSTLGLWLVDESGTWMNERSIAIQGAFSPGDPTFQYQLAQAGYQDCYWSVNFAAEFSQQSIAGCPVAFALTGRGRANQPDAFDIITWMPNTSNGEALQALIDIGVICEDPPKDPDPEDPVPCEWKVEPAPVGPNICSGADGDPGYFCAWGYDLFLRVDGDRFNGKATAFASGAGLSPTAYCSSGAWSCSRSNSVLYQIFLEGTDCCQDCTIEITATPSFSAVVSLNPNGSATASGSISVCAPFPCSCAVASGSITVDNSETAFGSINGVPFVQPLVGGVGTIAPIGNMPACTLNQCSATVSIAVSATLAVHAYTSLFNNYAQADASLRNASPGLGVSATTNCPDEPPVDLEVTVR